MPNWFWIQVLLMIVSLFISVYMVVKNEHTLKTRNIIREAIRDWALSNTDIQCEQWTEMFDSMEDYNNTFNRVRDWGLTRILPPEKYELIKPYIKQA